MDSEQLKSRTKKFAHRCVKLAFALPDNTLGCHLRGQLIRSSTSVAANYRAVCVALSKKMFISKMSIVIEETDETNFWLEFIKDEGLFPEKKISALLTESSELTSIFISSRKTAQNSLVKEDTEEYFIENNQ